MKISIDNEKMQDFIQSATSIIGSALGASVVIGLFIRLKLIADGEMPKVGMAVFLVCEIVMSALSALFIIISLGAIKFEED